MQRPRDLAVAFSLANLCYLRIWSELLTYTRANTYLMKTPPVPAEYAAVVMNVLLAGALFWGLATAARRFCRSERSVSWKSDSWLRWRFR